MHPSIEKGADLKSGNIDQDYFRLISRPGEIDLLQALSQPRHSRDERLVAGQALRQLVPRSSHAEYRPSPDRLNPIERLGVQNATLLPKLVGLRMARMSETPFAFLRGTAAVMAADLAATPATGLQVMACGDMHLANFGLFASAERNLVFGINDFDEAIPAPGSGTSSVSPPARRSLWFLRAVTGRRRKAPPRPPCGPTSGKSAATPRWASSRPGTT